MFSPMGKKKILLEQRYIKTTKKHLNDNENTANLGDNAIAEDTNVQPPKKISDVQMTDSIASMTVLDKSLKDPGILGVVMNKILHATVRYHPERDSATLKAFQSKRIEYEQFRSYLYSAFWLGFDDQEFKVFLDYFDPLKNEVINGYDFMIAFIKLGTIRKAQFSEEIRKKQEVFMIQQKEDSEKKQEEKTKKMELAADFQFTQEMKYKALIKLQEAAFKFDPNHPSCGSTEAFNVNYLKPAVFKEMLKLTFNLKVDRAELGAILKEFKPEIEEDPNIPAAEFLRYFLRIGIDLRDKAAKEQREKQLLMNQQMEEELVKKLKAAEAKMNQEVDFNFSERDEILAKEKLQIASLKYDRYSTGSVSLDGFECDSLDAGQFKDLVRRVFNLNITSGELGYIVKKYDLKNNGKVNCKIFLNEFLRLGNEGRYKQHLEQLQRQKALFIKAEEDHIKKVESVLNSGSLDISDNYSERDLDSALKKLTEASIRYDKVRGVSLISFEPSTLSPLEFKKAIKRTFNLQFSASEMGAVVQYFATNQSKTVNCQKFLTTFTLLGASKKSSIKTEQLQKQRDLWKKQKEEDDAKCLDLSSKILYQVDFQFTDEEKFSAMQKLTEAAIKYDVSHPASLGLDGFEQKTMSGGEFKELVRRTFNLKLNGKEVGAVFSFFENNSSSINCSEFLRYFLHLGITERAKVKSEQLERQRKEDREREEENEKKALALANRVTFEVDYNFTEDDKQNIIEKMNKASEGFDKSHPAAPSLEAFDVAFLTPGLFRENLKRVFNVLASPKEIGYLMTLFDKRKTGSIDSKEFMIKFLSMGKKIRDEKRKVVLEKQRLAIKEAAEEEERKLNENFEKAELKVDYDFNSNHLDSAFAKFTDASFRYDKTHPAAPNLDGFMGGPIKPGAFRELIRKSFNINLEHKELGACVKHFPHEKLANMVDGKAFLIEFMRLGFNAKAKAKMYNISKQRQFEIQTKQESEMKLLQAQQKVELDLNNTKFDLIDQENAIKKLTVAAALYDKNSPGCVALDAFDSAHLTPGIFREVAKRTFNIVYDDKELAAMINLYDNGHNKLDCQKFLVSFIKIGAEEREKVKLIQIEKQRKDNYLRKTEHERKMKELEDKILIDVKYDYTDGEKESVFEKLKIQAKKYDKNHPGAMSLDGFEQKQMKPHVFREMIKRTFGVVLTPGELGACMHYFDPKITGTISSKKFLIYFLKLGIVERELTHKSDLEKLRTDALLREREHTEKLAAQWAKMELNLNLNFTEEDKQSALEKLAEASLKFDPTSPGPMGLTAFQGKSLSPAIFREMLRRSFNMKVTDGELAALINRFDADKSNTVSCQEFMVEFTRVGFERRSARQLAQINKQRKMDEDAIKEHLEKQIATDLKYEQKIDMDFDSRDFSNALEKIRILASNYDRSHPAAPSLVGFTGTNMKPKEFKFMLLRTFNLTITDKELGALISVFGVKRENKSDQPSIRDKDVLREGVRINNNEFLKYFNKIQRDEQSRKHKERILQERMLLQKERDIEIALEKKKISDSLQLLIHNAEDEISFLEKVKQAAENFAIDSALFLDGIQGFKGPALPPDKFRELFLLIFNIKFSFSEVGVLLSIIDPGGNATIDGTRFLNWFYKICRYQERFLLGEILEPLSFIILKESMTSHSMNKVEINKDQIISNSSTSNSRKSHKKSASFENLNPISLSWENEFKATKNTTRSHTAQSLKLSSGLQESKVSVDSSVDTFSQSFFNSTINKNWILPSITTSFVSVDHQSIDNASEFGLMQYGADDDNWSQSEQQNADKVLSHLDLVFNMDINEDGQLIYKSDDMNNIPLTEVDTQNSFTSSAFKEINSKSDISMATLDSPLKKNKSTTNLSISVPSESLYQTRLYTAPNLGNPKKINNSHSNQKSDLISNSINIEENSFLHSLFLPNSTSPYAKAVATPERFAVSTLQKKHPPLVKLEKLQHHLNESPIAIVQKSQAFKKSKLHRKDSPDKVSKNIKAKVDSSVANMLAIPVIIESNSSTDISGISTSLAGPRLKATIATKSDKDKLENNGAGGFFFPALLMPQKSDLNLNSEEKESKLTSDFIIKNVTNIGIVNGTLLDTDSFIH